MKKMVKKGVALTLTLMLTISMVFTGCGKSSKEADTIKIGLCIPVTGNMPDSGKLATWGAEMAADEINAAGGVLGKQVELVIEDDNNKGDKAATAVQKLIDKDKVVGIVGSAHTVAALPMGPVCTQNKIPLISPNPTNVKITKEGGEYVYQIQFTDPVQAAVLADFTYNELKLSKAAVLYNISNDYPKALAEAFVGSFEGQGGKVIATETYNEGDTDFKVQLTKIKETNPEVILFPDLYANVSLVVQQAREMGIKAQFIGGDGWANHKLIDIAGDATEGAYLTTSMSVHDPDEKVQEFVKNYKALYSDEPANTSTMFYDAVNVLCDAIERAGTTDGEAIKDALKETDLDCVTGNITFDEERHANKEIVIVQIVNGEYNFITKMKDK
jgi:ABC-type branched-chain amino acid transport systems, periplasmic component